MAAHHQSVAHCRSRLRCQLRLSLRRGINDRLKRRNHPTQVLNACLQSTGFDLAIWQNAVEPYCDDGKVSAPH